MINCTVQCKRGVTDNFEQIQIFTEIASLTSRLSLQKISASSAIHNYVFYALIDTVVFVKSSCKRGVSNKTGSLYRYTVACVYITYRRSLELDIKVTVYSLCVVSNRKQASWVLRKPVEVERKWTRNVTKRLQNIG